MNPLEDPTTSNEFGELSEEELMKIVGGAAVVKVSTTIIAGKLVTRNEYNDGTVTITKDGITTQLKI